MKLGLLTMAALSAAAVAPVPVARDVPNAVPQHQFQERALFDWLFGGSSSSSTNNDNNQASQTSDNGNNNNDNNASQTSDNGNNDNNASQTSDSGNNDNNASQTTSNASSSSSSEGGIAGFFGGLFGGGNKQLSSSEETLSVEGEATLAIDPTNANSVSSGVSASDLKQSFSLNVLFTAGEILSTQSKPYQPYYTQCPQQDIVRKADKIGDDEKQWIAQRQEKTNPKLIEFLEGAGIDNAKELVEQKDRNLSVGLAFSGGGYRAMLAGAGQLLALDDSFNDSKSKGLGGILQGSTYLVGLSGGNWLVGTVSLNDGLLVGDIWLGHSDVWNLEETIFNQGGFNVIEIVKTYTQMGTALDAKDEAGFDTSITDLWGRALSYQFYPEDTREGENVSWLDIRDMELFTNHQMPFPIVVANGRTPGSIIINENLTVFEFNPYEMGTWDHTLGHMIDVKYLGTQMSNGKPVDSNKCVVKFDNGGFIMGTLSSLFNQALVKALQLNLPQALKTVTTKILNKLKLGDIDVANYRPNPFYNLDQANSLRVSNNETLYLVDGGEDNQNIPFYPLIQPYRKVDVILAYDNSADTKQLWPNGTSIASTFQRQFNPQGKGSPFPYAPPVKVFLDEELGTKPVFFGCNASALDDLIGYHDVKDMKNTDIPLVVHIPNHEYSYHSNELTYKMYYSPKEKYSMIQNGFEVSSQGNGTTDKDWKKCVACAIVRRSEERQNKEQSDECKKCFDRYCWNGGAVDAVYDSDFAAYLKLKGKQAPPVSDVFGQNRTASNHTNSSAAAAARHSSVADRSTSIDSSSASGSDSASETSDSASSESSGSDLASTSGSDNNEATTTSNSNIFGGLFGAGANTDSIATGRGSGTATPTAPTKTTTLHTQDQSGGNSLAYSWVLLLLSMLM